MALSKFTKTRQEIRLLPPGKKERAAALLSKIQFMEIQLESLQEQIPVSGWTETYQNGANQKGIKKSTEGDVYNTLIKNYTTAIGALNRMLPSGGKDTDDLLEFIGGSK